MHYQTKKKLDAIKVYIQREFRNWHKKYPNLIGAYPGEKTINKKPAGRYSVVFMVSRKQKRPATKIPDAIKINIPGEGKKKILTDVVQKEKFQFKSANLSDGIKRTGLTASGTTGVFLVSGETVYAGNNRLLSLFFWYKA